MADVREFNIEACNFFINGHQVVSFVISGEFYLADYLSFLILLPRQDIHDPTSNLLIHQILLIAFPFRKQLKVHLVTLNASVFISTLSNEVSFHLFGENFGVIFYSFVEIDYAFEIFVLVCLTGV